MAETPEELLKRATHVMAETLPKVTDAFDVMRRERDAAVASLDAVTAALGYWMYWYSGDVRMRHTPEGAVLAVLLHVDRLNRERDEAHADLGAIVAVLGTWVEGKGGEWKQHTPRNALLALLAHVDRLTKELAEARAERDARLEITAEDAARIASWMDAAIFDGIGEAIDPPAWAYNARDALRAHARKAT